jgi:uncharacterized protein (DUF433 family)
MHFDRIAINSNVAYGQACVKGSRMPVHQVVRMLANGDTVEDLLADYPFLSREDVMACPEYAAALAEEQVTPIETANLWPMRILVDENIPRMTVTALVSLGHDVVDIRGTARQGLADPDLWALAVAESRILVTTDKASRVTG